MVPRRASFIRGALFSSSRRRTSGLILVDDGRDLTRKARCECLECESAHARVSPRGPSSSFLVIARDFCANPRERPLRFAYGAYGATTALFDSNPPPRHAHDETPSSPPAQHPPRLVFRREGSRVRRCYRVSGHIAARNPRLHPSSDTPGRRSVTFTCGMSDRIDERQILKSGGFSQNVKYLRGEE